MALSPVPAGLVIPGNILADLGWEGATVGADGYTNQSDTGPLNGQWLGQAGGPVGPGRCVVVGSPNTRNSDRALYLEVRDGDYLAGSNERVQVQAGTIREYDNNEGWYSFSSYLLPNISASPSIPWALMYQFHAEADGSPPVSLVFDGGQMGLKMHRYTLNTTTGYTVHFPWRKPLSLFTSRWTDWRLRIKWSASDDIGFVQLWVDNVPQVFDFPSGLGASDPSGRNWGRGSTRLRMRTNRFGIRNYLTLSLYRAASTSGTWGAYFDNVRISDGVGYVEGTNPGDGSTTPPPPDPSPTYPAEDPVDSIMGVEFASARMQECRTDQTRGTRFELPTGAVTKRVPRMKVFMDGNGSGSGPQSCRAHINLASDGSLVAQSNEVQVQDGVSPGWVTFTFASPPTLTEGVGYFLCMHSGLNTLSCRFSNSPSGDSRWGTDTYADGPPTNLLTLNTATDGVDIYAVLEDPPALTGAMQAAHTMSFTNDASLVPAAGQQVTNVAYVLDGPTITYQQGTYREVPASGDPSEGAEVEWDGTKFIYKTS